ncbi:DUF72 domain-containing protein [Chitinophaga agri]|uniref:DUF72 domain-containing protein n=1 Tax=Chitinophaga agri TaxID=2703787 RepID=A0A6B9ZQH7_9BACT|nr:DUF72 domain-containing protein [Chitinophaga agri]QHS63213.1 DUF72 domain-containing protein [Chitinophaga agri]
MDVIDQFYAGTSGLVLPVPNKQAYPPAYKDKSRLTFYASLFNSLEVNSSFYKIPMAGTTRRWATEVPEGFAFTFKLFRGITHNKGLDFDPAVVTQFMQVIDQVGDRKGALLIQFPASIVFDSFGQLERLLDVIRQCDPDASWDICIEYRHPSWYESETFELLADYNAAMVLHDMPKSTPPDIRSSVRFAYLRFHGPAGDYKGGYPDKVLQQYTNRIHGWLDEGKRVYTYFNNTAGDALPNLETLRRQVNGIATK